MDILAHAWPLPGRRLPGDRPVRLDRTRTLFVGDTLFAGSIGRTDLPGGDMETLLRSIREVLFAFPDETAVHSGHGPATTIGTKNRRIRFSGRDQPFRSS